MLLTHAWLRHELWPPFVLFVILTGVVYHLKKDYGQAEQEYRWALAIDPSLAIAKNNLQKLLTTKRNKHST